MSDGTFEDFPDALRAFESGWDSARYATGQIADWQLDQWSGGTVSDFYPGLSSWGEMKQDQWDEMPWGMKARWALSDINLAKRC